MSDSVTPEQVPDLWTVSRQDLQQGGLLSQRLPGYEERPAQIQMAELVAQALTKGVHAISEASTGTGKSLSYLIPIVRSGKVAIISTANKGLQEQLFYKDIPFVQQHIAPFKAALVKGMSNYVCLNRLENERVGLQYYVRNPAFMRLLKRTEEPPGGFNGDFETLGFQLPADIRRAVQAESEQCAWNLCPFFADCFVRDMRLEAQDARIIVVNHTLLLLDAVTGGNVLPERDIIVVDEAQHLEEEATKAFTTTIGLGQITSLLEQHRVRDHVPTRLQSDVLLTANTVWRQLEKLVPREASKRIRLSTPIEEGIRLAEQLKGVASVLQENRPDSLDGQDGSLYDKLVRRTRNLAEQVRLVFSVSLPEQFVYYIERVGAPGSRHAPAIQVSAAPFTVAPWLKERLFDTCPCVCTSATLATLGSTGAGSGTGANFAYFRARVGLNEVPEGQVLERILPLTFDYQRNALLYLPRNIPEPMFGDDKSAEEYITALARQMYSLVRASRGRAFLLFSSRRALDQVYEKLAPHLDFPLLRQGDLTRIELVRQFRQVPGSVLFGLKSFWEGVDIAGEALSLVVIDKLPFDPPDDPVHEARIERMKAAGENWFGTYVLPQAVLRLKQGLGRLLRTHEDRGVMAVLDARLHTKGYGKSIIAALPPVPKTSNIADVVGFFAPAAPPSSD